MKTYRYEIGGVMGDQLPPLVEAIIQEADDRPDGRARLREIVEAIRKRLDEQGRDQ